MSEVFRFERKSLTRNVPGIGTCEFAAPTLAAWEMVDDFAAAPHRMPVTYHTCAVLAAMLQTPQISASEIAALPALTRRRLVAASADAAGVGADYRRLRGSYLSGEERLLAALMWDKSRQLHALQERIRHANRLIPESPAIDAAHAAQQQMWDAGFARYDAQVRRAMADLKKIESFRDEPWREAFENFRRSAPPRLDPKAERALRDLRRLPDLEPIRAAQRERLRAQPKFDLGAAASSVIRGAVEAVRKTLRDFASVIGEGLRTISENLDRHPLALLINEMYGFYGFELMARDLRSEVEALDAIEAAFDDPDFIEALVNAIDASDAFDPEQKERAGNGLRTLRDPGQHWTSPRDALHAAIEGALWSAALREGVLDGERHLVQTSRPFAYRGSFVKHASGLLGEGDGLDVHPHLRRFLVERVLDPRSHDARHARSGARNRRYALNSAIALLAWLDRSAGEPWAISVLAERISAVVAEEPEAA